MAEEHPREVIREHHFERDLRALISDPIAADAFVEAAEFILARDPRSGIQDELSPELWWLPMSPVEGEQVTLFYTFDEQTVWLIAIERL